jgi:hypothetical protein
MYIAYLSRGTTGGSNSVVRYIWAALPCNSYIKLGAAYGLYLLEIGQTALITEIAWGDLCAGWGTPSAFWRIGWGFSMNPLVSGLSK